MKRLEEILDVPRDEWPPSALRSLWDPLLACSEKRLKGPRHESRWFNLAGFFLRPGRGYPLDEVRIKALWPVFHQGVKHIKDVQCWAEWWILWRRVAAGLARPHHEEIYRRLAPFLLPVKGSSPSKKAGRPKPEAHEMAEMWRCAASLERVAPDVKEALGDALVKELAQSAPGAHVYWCLGRLGARVPLYGPANTVVRKEAARALDGHSPGPRLRRRERDRRRHLRTGPTGKGRERPRPRPRRSASTPVIARLTDLGADENELKPVREYHELESAQQVQALGDSLPIGLRLVREG